eukprot:13484387-Ditylum_brightwellii.AAC.1
MLYLICQLVNTELESTELRVIFATCCVKFVLAVDSKVAYKVVPCMLCCGSTSPCSTCGIDHSLLKYKGKGNADELCLDVAGSICTG